VSTVLTARSIRVRYSLNSILNEEKEVKQVRITWIPD